METNLFLVNMQRLIVNSQHYSRNDGLWKSSISMKIRPDGHVS